jgi:hypothetical protein
MKIELRDYDPYIGHRRWIAVSEKGNKFRGLASCCFDEGSDWGAWTVDSKLASVIACLESIKADMITRALIRAVIAAACRAGIRTSWAFYGDFRNTNIPEINEFADHMISRRKVSRCELVYRYIVLTIAAHSRPQVRLMKWWNMGR